MSERQWVLARGRRRLLRSMGKKKIVTKSSVEDSNLKTSGKESHSVKSTSKKAEIGKIFINSTYNNTLVTIADKKGNCLAWASAGSLGFSGPKKSTPFAASKVIGALVEKLKGATGEDVEVFVKGVGSGRDSAIRSLMNQGFHITSIRDITPIPHNGPRPPKPRRV